MLESLTSIKISCDDPGPNLTCYGCYVAMKVAYTTQQRLIKTEMLLQEKILGQLVVKEEIEESGSELEMLETAIKCEDGISEEIQPEDQYHNETPSTGYKNKNPTFLKCETCPNTYDNYFDYSEHSKGHEMKQCLMCPQVISAVGFREHNLTHDTGYCEYCGAQLKHALSLRKHVQLYHREPKIMCEQCGEILDNRRMFDTHITTHHTKDAAFICDHCGAKFYSVSLLKKHIKQQHTIDEQFSCNVCGKAFGLKSKLKAHGLKHSDERLFICEFCGKGFKEKGTMNTHKKGVHGWKSEEKFRCKLCDKGFATKFALSTHVVRKHKE
ncbi:hypothetical protein Zmor_004383 [Zophobas morio]|uniref:C2H2-type domain-containing protein n=1 Tax=Zophobas morio TaxID=2755281 RepID=A0AA38LZG8_9CUCU|nr:hypothetical protein Zmor_004383 [Zophobas morio]